MLIIRSLDKMGVAQKTRRCLIKKEVGILFFIPAILPMIMMIFLIAGANKVFGEAILQENLFLTYGIVTLTVFSGIYLLYYWATTSVFSVCCLKKGIFINEKRNKIQYFLEIRTFL